MTTTLQKGERLTTHEAAEVIGVHVQTLKHARANGNVFNDGTQAPPYYRVAPRRIYYTHEDIENWLANRRVE